MFGISCCKLAEAGTEVNQVHSISFEPMDVHLCSIFLSIMQQKFSSATATEKILWEVMKMFKIHWEILPKMYKQIKETKTMIITRDEKMQKKERDGNLANWLLDETASSPSASSFTSRAWESGSYLIYFWRMLLREY